MLGHSNRYSARGFRKVSVGTYYLDKDEKKGRELDIKVPIPIFYRGRIGVFLNLLIACKGIPGNAWVFFKTPHERTLGYPCCTSILDSLERNNRLDYSFKYLPGLHYRDVMKTTVYQEYISAEKKSNKKVDNLFEAIITLAKATSYDLENSTEEFKNNIDKLGPTNGSGFWFPILKLFYPTIIFDGKIYLAEKTDVYGEMDLTPIDHICLSFHYLSGSDDIDLYIDIVQREAFDKFFNTIIKDVEVLNEALVKDIGIKFREEVTKAVNWYKRKKPVVS